jgi:hypothetical protein
VKGNVVSTCLVNGWRQFPNLKGRSYMFVPMQLGGPKLTRFFKKRAASLYFASYSSAKPLDWLVGWLLWFTVVFL